MKKLVSLAVLSALTVTAADAAPSHISRGRDGAYKVTYDYTEKAKTGWYVGGRVALGLTSWENDNKTDAPSASELSNDSYSEILFGGALSAGYRFDYFWRAEIEGGLIGQFEDEDAGTTFKMTVPYLMANGYYDFANGLYVGAGAGVALPKTKLQGIFFTDGDDSESGISPILGVMLGYSHKLDNNLVLDLRYRLSGFVGPEHKRKFIEGDGIEYDIKTDVGMVLDNSVSFGLRYEF
ncbi:MAG: hypothetical protein IKW67_02345 [Alphaproteobacteria bacterium]|nr:hypothetical protein [Alphaproteobacteria bacterium]